MSTYNGRKEAAGAEHSEYHCESESSNEEYKREQEDIGDGVGNVSVVTRVASHVPASLQTLLLSHAASTHFYTLIVCQTIRIQLVYPIGTARNIVIVRLIY